jgi:branched-chain amino acid transport system substrate-binding protein
MSPQFTFLKRCPGRAKARAAGSLGASVLVASLTLTACSTPNGSSAAAGSGASCSANGQSPGVTSSTITLGATMPLTGSAAQGGLGTLAGQNAYFSYVNSHGGVKGRKIKFIGLDDQYLPSVAVQQMKLLVQNDHVFAIDGGEGTPNFLANLPFLKETGIPTIAPYSPSSELGTMSTPNIYMIAPNYVQEFNTLTSYIYDHFHAKSYSLVGVTGNVDQNALQGMQEALQGKGATVHNIPEVPGTSNMAPLASQLQRYNAQWVFLILTNGDTGNLLEAMKRVGYNPQLASWSGMTEQSYIDSFGAVSQGLIAVEEELPATSTAPGVQSMVSQYKAITGSSPNSFNELGWVQAELAVKALQSAKYLTWSCLEQSLNGIRSFDTGVLPSVDFGPANRQGSTGIALAQIEGSKLTQLNGFISPAASGS